MLKNLFKPTLSLLLALSSASVLANTYNFTGVNADLEPLGGQLSVNVTQVNSTTATFNFINAAGGTTSSIATIYFDFLGSNLFTSLAQTGSTGVVNFTADFDDNQNFPEGNNLDPNFDTDASANRTAGRGANANRIEIGESLLLTAGLVNNTNILALLDSGELRIGLHIQAIGETGGSDSYVNAVPLPAAGWLFGSALVGLMGLRRKMH